jgi:hypothetical protein
VWGYIVAGHGFPAHQYLYGNCNNDGGCAVIATAYEVFSTMKAAGYKGELTTLMSCGGDEKNPRDLTLTTLRHALHNLTQAPLIASGSIVILVSPVTDRRTGKAVDGYPLGDFHMIGPTPEFLRLGDAIALAGARPSP